MRLGRLLALCYGTVLLCGCTFGPAGPVVVVPGTPAPPPNQVVVVPVEREAPDAASFELGTRVQVRTLELPTVPRGMTASFELPGGQSGWAATLPENGMGVTPAYGHGKVFIGGGFASRTMYALDARTGRVAWTARAPDGGPSAAIVVDDKVLFNTESCTIFAVNINTGRIIWRRWLGDPMMSQPAAAAGRVFTAHRLTSVRTGWGFTALNVNDGSVIWQRPIPADIVSAPALEGDSIFFTSQDGTTHRIAQRTGETIWAVNVGATTAPWVDGNRVLLARRAGTPSGRRGPFEHQVVLDAANGTILRRGKAVSARHLTGAGRARELLTKQAGAWGNTGESSSHLGLRNVAEGWAYQGARPTVIDGRAYMVVGDQIQCRNSSTGRLLWSRRYAEDGGALAVSPPAVVGSQLVIATVDGHVYGLDIDTGMTVWAYDVGEPVVFQPAIARGWVYVSTAQGRVIAFPVGDETLDGWHMWGGSPSHEGPRIPASMADARRASADDAASNDGPGQGSLQVVVPNGTSAEELPLRRTSVTANVSGFVASVTVRQEFANTHDEPLEAAYHFPLPANAAVDAMELSVGERNITGSIKRRRVARTIYRRAREAGRVAALLEQQRPNLFTQRVANIPPGESVTIELHYVQMLPYDSGTYEFMFPLVAGTRAEDPTAPASNDDDEDELEQPAAGQTARADQIDVTLNVDAGVPLEHLASPSHTFNVTHGARPGQALLRLSSTAPVPNRDLIVRYRVAGEMPRAAVLEHRDERGGFFTLVVQPARDDGDLPITRRRITLALDTSSSMHGAPMEQARTVANTILSSLREGDSFQVITFSDEVRMLAPRALEATEANVNQASQHLAGLRALGTTAMTAGLTTALRSPRAPEEVLDMVVLVTDGYIASERNLMALVNERLGNRRLFAVGVGSAPNRYLLERLSEVGRGAHVVVAPTEAPDEVARDFLARIDRPQLTDLRIDWARLNVSAIYPSRLPDLFAGQPLLIHGRFQGEGRDRVTLRGNIAGEAWSTEIPVAFGSSERNEAMASVWARAAIHDEMNRLYLRDDADARERVTDLGLQFGLVTRFTSFVAVAEEDETEERARPEEDDEEGDEGDEGDGDAQQGDAAGTNGILAARSDAALGNDPENALGQLMGNQIGDSFGYGGLGLSGSGRGGGGTGQGTIGLGQLNSIGHGGGGGSGSGYGRGSGGLRGRRAAIPRIRFGAATVRGALSKTVIRRYIRRHTNQLRYCYEQQLADNPELRGRITVRFVISATGAVSSAVVVRSTVSNEPVEECVLRVVRQMSFPRPQGGGVVVVTYPFNFAPAE